MRRFIHKRTFFISFAFERIQNKLGSCLNKIAGVSLILWLEANNLQFTNINKNSEVDLLRRNVSRVAYGLEVALHHVDGPVITSISI